MSSESSTFENHPHPGPLPAYREREKDRLMSLHKRHRLFTIAAVIAASSPLLAHASAAVDTAIEKGKTFLYSKQSNGNWETGAAPASQPAGAKVASVPTNQQWCGATALATYALLACGESPQGDRLAPTVKFLQEADITGTYALAMRAQLYYFLPASPQLHREAQDDADYFLNGRPKKATTRPAAKKTTPTRYSYSKSSSKKPYAETPKPDRTASQWTVLGMRACEYAGAEVPRSFWSEVEAGWVRDQDPDSGGWSYDHPPAKVTISASLTAAGVATLFMTQDYLHADAGVRCVGNSTSPHIDAGLAWLSAHYDRILESKSANLPYYALYGMQRVGNASGRKFFGDVDWYQNGVDFLLSHQQADGSWGSLQDTSLALLFLSRGREPVVLSKLQYDDGAKPGNWNERPRDAANLTRYISKETERELNWQIVDLHVESHDLHEAPILLITGNEPLNLTPENEAKLKAFCTEGGIILANADGASSAFVISFRKLATRLFPDYEMRPLPADSPILRNEQYPAARWKTPVPVQSLSNGVREMMMLLPDGDPAKWWQLDDVTKAPAFQFADDLFLYAVDKQNLLEKGDTYLVQTDASLAPTRTVRMARLQYEGNWDPEPAGWTRLATILHNTADITLKTAVIKLGENKLGTGHGIGIRLAHLTGTTRLTLSPNRQKEIHDFVTGGGTLIVDAAGGSADFADSAEQQLITIFGPDAEKQLKSPLPASAPLYRIPGGEIDRFGFRQYARTMLGSMEGPQLAAISINGRPAVFFSRLDLSAGLVGQQVDGIIGYTPATATAIVRNLVATGLGRTPHIQPTPKATAN